LGWFCSWALFAGGRVVRSGRIKPPAIDRGGTGENARARATSLSHAGDAIIAAIEMAIALGFSWEPDAGAGPAREANGEPGALPLGEHRSTLDHPDAACCEWTTRSITGFGPGRGGRALGG
jgi:hypothetical protein